MSRTLEALAASVSRRASKADARVEISADLSSATLDIYPDEGNGVLISAEGDLELTLANVPRQADDWFRAREPAPLEANPLRFRPRESA